MINNRPTKDPGYLNLTDVHEAGSTHERACFTMLAMARARIADIAAHAGVSEATVSRVLNGKPGVRASKSQAVLTALDVLGYERPERLRTRSAGLVGLVMPELSNPIFPAFAEWIERALTRQGYTLK